MIATASRMMRSTSSRQLGMSWISPATMPADQIPASASPLSSACLPRSPETRCLMSSMVALPPASMDRTSSETALRKTRAVLRSDRKIRAVLRSVAVASCCLMLS